MFLSWPFGGYCLVSCLTERSLSCLLIFKCEWIVVYAHQSAECLFLLSMLLTNDSLPCRDDVTSTHSQYQWPQESSHGVIQRQYVGRNRWRLVCSFSCFATLAYRRAEPTFPFIRSAIATERHSTSTQRTSEVQAWWCACTLWPWCARQVTEDPQHGVNALQIWILWKFTYEANKTNSVAWVRERTIPI
jgi:hypothetical protein